MKAAALRDKLTGLTTMETAGVLQITSAFCHFASKKQCQPMKEWNDAKWEFESGAAIRVSWWGRDYGDVMDCRGTSRASITEMALRL